MSATGFWDAVVAAVGRPPCDPAEDTTDAGPADALRPRENPKPKKSAQTITSAKKNTSSLPVPRVISVSCEVAMVASETKFKGYPFAAAGPLPLGPPINF